MIELWVLICMVHLTVCSYHVTYAFLRNSLIKTGVILKIKWLQQDLNPQPLSLKMNTQPFSHTDKWLSYVVFTYMYDVFDCVYLLCHMSNCEWIYIFVWKSGNSLLKTDTVRKVKWLEQDLNPQSVSYFINEH